MISLLRDKLTLLSPVRVPDEAGGYEIDFEVRDIVSARSESKASRVDKTGNRHAGLFQKQFTIRHRDDLVFEMRLEHENRQYRITDIREESDRKRFQFVTATEVRP